MKLRDFYYININREKNEVFSCGAQFSEFIEFVFLKPINILLLKGCFYAGKWHDTGFEYVDSENMNKLIEDNVYNYGDFCWVDFNDKNSIDAITPIELSELLYISHRFIPLHTPFFNRLNNNYVYLAHDDDYWTRIYMKNIQDYKKVIEGKILKALKGRKKQITSLPQDIIELIFDGAKEGILFDFPNICFCEGRTGVRIYKIGEYYNYNQIRDVFERKQNCSNNSIYLEYYRNKWRIYNL